MYSTPYAGVPYAGGGYNTAAGGGIGGGYNAAANGGIRGGAGMIHAGGGAAQGGAVAVRPNGAAGAACGVGPGEDCTACGVACGGGGGSGTMAYVGYGQGEYVQETTYKYVGCGGDFDNVRPKRDFTCLVSICCLLSLLLLIPLLMWLFGETTSVLWDCTASEGDMAVDTSLWPQAKKQFCCVTAGTGCEVPSTVFPETTPTQPPTPPPTRPPTPPPTPPPTLPPTPPPSPTQPSGPVDPFNCAVGAESDWAASKKAWCCQVHHLGCATLAPTAPPATLPPMTYPPLPPVMPTAAPPPPDPYNCAEGFANWMAGWSVGKKAWCCRVHGKGCPQSGGGCGTTSPPYDCNAGFANWMAGWSVAKKAWCCKNQGKGCPPSGGGCA